MRTCAVIVGGSEYQQREILTPLPGAARDAAWLERFLLERGLPRTSITSLVGVRATKAAILSAIRECGRSSEGPLRVLVFLSAHGGTLKLSGRKEPVIFCADTSITDRLATSITAGELLKALSDISHASEVFLFVDACYMASDPLVEQIRLLTSRAQRIQAFCCVIANDDGISLEGLSSTLGEFSSALLSAIVEVEEQSSPSVGALLHSLAAHALRRGLGKPSVLAFGDLTSWPFRFDPIILPETDTVLRTQFVRQIIDALRYRHAARVCVVGDSGSGKSVVLAQALRKLGAAPFLRITREERGDDPERLLARFTQAICSAVADADETVGIVNSLPAAAVWYATNHPAPVLVVDGGENVADDVWRKVIRVLDESGFDLLTTRHSMDLPGAMPTLLPIAPLDEREALSVAKLKNVTDSDVFRFAFSKSGGHPLRFLSALQSREAGEPPEDLKPSIDILGASGGFHDANLFAAVCGVSAVDLQRLRSLGLLIRTNDLEMLHDAAKADANASQQAWPSIISYWAGEMDRGVAVAAVKLLELAQRTPIDSWPSGTLARAIRISEPVVCSRTLVDALKSRPDASALIAAVDIISRRGDSALLGVAASVAQILDLSGSTQKERIDFWLAQARGAWWQGNYDDCKGYALKAISLDQTSEAARLEIAICDFFLGRWDEVEAALGPLVSFGGDRDLRLVGWAKLILGTCLAIRGVDITLGRQLLSSAGDMLRAARDLAGVAIAKGNNGEVCWKSGLYPEAKAELEQGLNIASDLGMWINEVEAHRNFVQLLLRWRGPHDPNIAPHSHLLGLQTIETIGEMEMMQVANTLATLALYRENVSLAESWLSVVRPLTEFNLEYDIYTKANEALISAARGRFAEASSTLSAAVELCEQGRNLLALNQIRQDVAFCTAGKLPKWSSEAIGCVDAGIWRLTHAEARD